MTHAPTGDPSSGETTGDPFARLQQDLADLDYTPIDTRVRGCVTYTGPDGRMIADIDRSGAPHLVSLVGMDVDKTPGWDLNFTATTPAHVQRLVLYTVLHAGLGDEASVLRSVAAALDVDLHAEAASTASTPVG
jgi:hypothetical protein